MVYGECDEHQRVQNDRRGHDDEVRFLGRGVAAHSGSASECRHDRGHGPTRGIFRETIAMAKAYAEARQQHGESELLDEIVSARPERDHTHYHSPDELKQHGLQHLRDSVEVLERKATPVEVEEYRQFIVNLTHKVAAAHREHGQDVSEPEQTAIDDIVAALNTTAG